MSLHFHLFRPPFVQTTFIILPITGCTVTNQTIVPTADKTLEKENNRRGSRAKTKIIKKKMAWIESRKLHSHIPLPLDGDTKADDEGLYSTLELELPPLETYC